MQSIEVFKKFVHLKFLLAFSAVFACWQTLIIANVKAATCYNLFAFVFFATLAAYNVRLMKLDSRNKSKTITLRFVSRNLTKEIIWALSSIVCIVLFCFFTSQTQLILVISSFASLLYIMPFTRYKNRLRGIRNIYFLKNIWLALTWALITVALPLAEARSPFFQAEHVLIFFSRFLFIYTIALLFDIRDSLHDKSGNVFTLATQNGIAFTKTIAVISILLFCVLVLFRIYLHPELMLLAPALYISTGLMLLLIILAKPGHNFWFYEVLMDGVLSIQALLIIVSIQVYN